MTNCAPPPLHDETARHCLFYVCHYPIYTRAICHQPRYLPDESSLSLPATMANHEFAKQPVHPSLGHTTTSFSLRASGSPTLATTDELSDQLRTPKPLFHFALKYFHRTLPLTSSQTPHFLPSASRQSRSPVLSPTPSHTPRSLLSTSRRERSLVFSSHPSYTEHQTTATSVD